MSIAQVSTQFFSMAMPAVGLGAVIVAFSLIASGLMLRWRRIRTFLKRFLFRRSQYDYRRIFEEHIERFNAITDRRELYPAILSATCRIVGAGGASLIVRDMKDTFQLKALSGLKPFSFRIDEVKPFLEWLGRHRDVVARSDLFHSKSLSEIKSEGLCYFVQFNAEACVPLFLNDRLYGVMNLGQRERCGYDKETREFLKLMAAQFSTTIHNANLYQALIHQNLKLQEVSRLKTQLLSNITHELRTPLSSIIGLSELLAEGSDGPVNEEQTRHLLLIRQSGTRLLDTVTTMLDISKIAANRLNLDVQKLNIGRLVNEVAGGVHVGEGITLEVKVNGQTPSVWGDDRCVRQVLRHLLDNAAKFTKRGAITVDAQKCGEMLRICVKDTGIGIPREKQKMVFDGFSQCDASHSREHEGLGLGLAVSKKLVELHGGRMWLSSRPGYGSDFYFTLPLKPIGAFGKEDVPHAA